VSLAGRRFRPGWVLTVAAMALVALFGRLGLWQLDRARQAEALNAAAADGARLAPIDLREATQPPAELRFRHVLGHGTFEGAGQILLDNQVQDGIVGVRVLTPLRLTGTDTRVLVDRGWIALDPQRRTVPDAPVPAGAVEVHGIVDVPAGPPPLIGRGFDPKADPKALWPFLDLARYATYSGRAVAPFIVHEDAGDAHGFSRAWQPPQREPSRHRGYALQWFAFALITACVYVALSLERSPRQEPAPSA